MYERLKVLVNHVGGRLKDVVYSPEKIEINFKGRGDLVTELDLWSEKELKKGLAEIFPGADFLGEESANDFTKNSEIKYRDIIKKGTWWVVDPIDGTTNFSNRIPHFAISIALVREGVTELGMIFDPCRGELFYAQIGAGSILNEQTIKVSKKNDLNDMVIASGFPTTRFTHWENERKYFEAVLLGSRQVRCLGAAAIELAWVACGRLDGFFEFNLKPWDYLAGELLIKEAGGEALSEWIGGRETSFAASANMLQPLRKLVNL